ncbi:SAM-dependent methyltransferase [Winogradskyella sp. PC-19]|uniref:class I SAM-dependent methyltransferase n=1 Tax=unclassified Winogradskyella TaxID=2615021 RepID=UPI000B3BF7CB|nr:MULTISPECIES: class I SAM-dependent methyltransferase [unclassified Winogradskyella]ARV09409.1 SAM-dependent methyltransferase [Winogradskyella sp. PC-19]
MLKKPWPTKAVMEQIYEKNLWGGKDFDFYSGIGSHDPMMVNLYVKTVTDFLKSHENKLTICDLGCGDFNIGKHFLEHSEYYYAIDIVESLIERNKKLYKAANLEFRCLDISKDNLPKADCVILRQVLQHLSNNEIQRILKKLENYKYIILTEHIPYGNFTPNKDKIAGQGIRLKEKSGVDILSAPFIFKVKKVELLNEVILQNDNGKIMTSLFIV